MMHGSEAGEVVQAYYDSWKDGIAAFDAPRLRSILAADLRFEGPIAGSRSGAEPFLAGLEDFVRSMQSYTPIHLVHSGDEGSALYDCTLAPAGGSLRFAEFFRVRDGRIQELRLLYDPNEFRRLRHPRG